MPAGGHVEPEAVAAGAPDAPGDEVERLVPRDRARSRARRRAGPSGGRGGRGRAARRRTGGAARRRRPSRPWSIAPIVLTLQQAQARGAEVDAVDRPVVQPGDAERAAVADALAQDPRRVGQGAAVLPGHLQHVEVVVGLRQARSRWAAGSTQRSRRRGLRARHQAGRSAPESRVDVEAVAAQEPDQGHAEPLGRVGGQARGRRHRREHRRCRPPRPSARSRSRPAPRPSAPGRRGAARPRGRRRRPPCRRRCGGRCPRAASSRRARGVEEARRVQAAGRLEHALRRAQRVRAARAGPRASRPGPAGRARSAPRPRRGSSLPQMPQAEVAGRAARPRRGRPGPEVVTVTTLKRCSLAVDVVAVGDARDRARARRPPR